MSLQADPVPQTPVENGVFAGPHRDGAFGPLHSAQPPRELKPDRAVDHVGESPGAVAPPGARRIG